MVGFDYLGCLGPALNNVRVNGSLRQEVDSLQLPCLFFKHADKLSTNDFALLLRVSHAFQFAQETFHGIHIYQVGVHLVLEYFDYALRFAFSHKTMIYMDTGKLPADCLNQKGRNNRAVHTAGQGQKHLPVPHLFTDQFYLVRYEVFHIPVGLGAACIKDKRTEYLGSIPIPAADGTLTCR